MSNLVDIYLNFKIWADVRTVWHRGPHGHWWAEQIRNGKFYIADDNSCGRAVYRSIKKARKVIDEVLALRQLIEHGDFENKPEMLRHVMRGF